MTSQRRTFLTTALVGAVVCGCGRPTARPADPAVARTAVETVLDGWKQGKKPGDVAPIVAQDPDWLEGAKLVEFRGLEDGASDELNYRCSVELVLESPAGKTTKRVTYVVGTNPKTTVFREVHF